MAEILTKDKIRETFENLVNINTEMDMFDKINSKIIFRNFYDDRFASLISTTNVESVSHMRTDKIMHACLISKFDDMIPVFAYPNRDERYNFLSKVADIYCEAQYELAREFVSSSGAETKSRVTHDARAAKLIERILGYVDQDDSLSSDEKDQMKDFVNKTVTVPDNLITDALFENIPFTLENLDEFYDNRCTDPLFSIIIHPDIEKHFGSGNVDLYTDTFVKHYNHGIKEMLRDILIEKQKKK